MLTNQLALITGSDIPFVEAGVIIHQPTIKEIGLLGEDNFFLGCGFLYFSKDLLNEKDKVHLENIDDFNILMTIMINRNGEKDLNKHIDCAIQVIYLLFPLYKIELNEQAILLKKDDQIFEINKKNFGIFKAILKEMFNLSFKNEKVQKEYDPVNDAAAAIAEKLKKRHKELAERSGSKGEIKIFGRMISIISVYSKISYLELSQYTIYQLYDAFSRVQLKMAYDIAIKARLAGAKDVKDPEDWTKDLYNNENK